MISFIDFFLWASLNSCLWFFVISWFEILVSLFVFAFCWSLRTLWNFKVVMFLKIFFLFWYLISSLFVLELWLNFNLWCLLFVLLDNKLYVCVINLSFYTRAKSREVMRHEKIRSVINKGCNFNMIGRPDAVG